MTEFSYGHPYAVHRVPVMARNIVAASQPLAAQAGVQMLLKGGNAVDAAVATAITLAVVEPTGNGIGSDAFAIVWDGTRLHGLNGSGRSPKAWGPERFSGLSAMPSFGWETVTVPGAVSAWAALSECFGRLPFGDLFEPAIAYARDGFLVSPTIAAMWANGANVLDGQPGFRETFMPGGRPPKPGELFVNTPQARTLEAIARSNGAAFYRGELAARIVRFAKEHGAALSMEDLEAHTADWCGTISTSFHGADLHEMPPNGQGIAALLALGILEHTEIDGLEPDSVEAVHLQIEAIKLAFADLRRHVGDPGSMTISVEEMLAPSYLASRAALIRRDVATAPETGLPKTGGTVYLTAADASGMMVSYIQSNNSGFGSGVVVPDTGIHLQNRGMGFTLEAGHANQVGSRKRPFHTIIPGFLMKHGQPVMSFGMAGGPMQPQGHVQMLLRTQVFGQNPQSAIDAPRWRVVDGRRVNVEWNFPEALAAALTARGHDIWRERRSELLSFGGAQLIHRLPHGYVAGSDHRKDGAAIGF